MTPRTWTIGILIAVTLLLIMWDVYVAFFNKVPNRQDTISGVVLGFAKRHPVIPFAIGVVCGHLLWPQ